jgi:hypothetical protein
MNLIFEFSLTKMALHKKNEGNNCEEQQRFKVEIKLLKVIFVVYLRECSYMRL